MTLPHPAARRATVARSLLAALLLAGLLTACSLAQPQPPPNLADLRLDPPANDQQSLVFGYLDMSDAPTPLGWIEFRQVSPVTQTPFYQMRVDNGVFYMEKFPPGVFLMGEFGGDRPDGKHLAYTLPRTSPAVRVTISKPGLYFVGAYKYRPVRDAGGTTGRFEIDALSAPSAKEVLARMLPYARGTVWEQRIQSRLNGDKTSGGAPSTSG
ncbi:MAG TPA: hypothetical protein VKB51_09010 [bacterium]|nr:hypothetical protein [bacterium]